MVFSWIAAARTAPSRLTRQSITYRAGGLASPPMPSLIGRVAAFARSPQGRRMAKQAQQWASDPKNKKKIADARKRLASKR